MPLLIGRLSERPWLDAECERKKPARAALCAVGRTSSMVKMVALLVTFSAGIFLVHAIEAYSDKAYRAYVRRFK